MLARNYLGKYSATPKIIKISLNKYRENFLIISTTILYYNMTCYFTLNITHNVESISQTDCKECKSPSNSSK